MKINRKRQLNSSMLMMMQCHNHIIECIDNESIELLELCQEMAIKMGTLVENETSEIENCHRIVEQLEKYCNEIFCVSEVLDLGKSEVSEKINICNDTISCVQELVHSLISEKQIAVFLPYNASMWDALDTVCRAAMKEDDWEVYVMPVPYYSLNKQGEVEKNRYEYKKFPKDLPLVSYEECSLEDMKPDVIFYHNPYDDRNLVTRVYPQFYTSNLMKITKHLIYIPYYLSTGKTMYHMLQMPGVLNAWKIIVQSKEMEQQFLEFFSKEKVVLLGSPKLDALAYEVQNTSILPSDWSEKIENKLVLFWNTHLTSVINQPDKFIEMIDYVMDIMERNPQVVIVWRPHPLMLESLQSFHDSPSLCQIYEQKVQQFQLKSNAIYDTTGELHRSMAISNAYIGTQNSSVYRLYKYLHRNMVVLPDLFDKKEKENGYINPMWGSGALSGEENYQFSFSHNALYSFNIKTGIVKYLSSNPQFAIAEKTEFRLEGKVDQWMILISNKQNEIVFCNCITGEYRSVCVEEKDKFVDRGVSILVQNGKVYLVYLNREDCHFVISPDDCSCRKENIFNAIPEECDIKQGNVRYLRAYDHYIYGYQDTTKTLIIYDVRTANYYCKKMPISIADSRILEIYIDRDDLYVMLRTTGQFIICENYKQDSATEVILAKDLCDKISNECLRMIMYIKGKIIFSVNFSDAIYCYNSKNRKFSIIRPHSTRFEFQCVYPNRCIQSEDGKTLYCMQTNRNHLLEIDVETETVSLRPLHTENAMHIMQAELSKEMETKGYGEFNSSYLNLQQFIDLLGQHDVKNKKGKELELQGNVGTKVWNAIAECMEES